MPACLPSSRRSFSALLMGSLLSLCACSGILSGEQSVFVSAGKLQDKLDKRFPMERKLLGLVAVTISNPRLSFDPAANRIGTRLQLAVPSVMALTPAMNGTVDVAYGLRYEPADNSVRMTQVQIRSVDLKDAQGRSNAQVNSTLARLGENLFQDYTLYKLTPDDLARASQYHYVPSGITVKNNGLDVLLAPRK